MLVPFTPHNVRIKGSKVVCPVILMDVDKDTGFINKEENVDKPKQEATIEYDPNDDENVDDKVVNKLVVEMIRVSLMIINSETGKYQWLESADVEAIGTMELN